MGLIDYQRLQFYQIQCGKKNGYMLDDKGELWSFGKNDKGQLGVNLCFRDKQKIQKIPININRMYIDQENKYKSIDAGDNHILCIDLFDKVYGWGYNKYENVIT